MRTLDALPASAEQVAVLLGITLKQAHGRLAYYKGAGKAKQTGSVPLLLPGKTGPRNTKLWIRT